ncbi:MAG TPA: LLM class flavin-dependent oxidoreductase [Stellaceae bacterium]|nr:LLM class flavin-dependent oxidoreductase [Stellaceae bacterium]
MKFTLALNMVRTAPSLDMREVARHALEMVEMADEGGFEIVWAAEHHAIELTIAPNPFQLLAWWGAHTSRIRLGTAVVVAPYWHPIKLAGEAALLDLLTDGRLEFGIGRGAYQREFDRMAGGMQQQLGVPYMQEMLPVLKALWQGDYEHHGKYWSFPASTSVPKPLQRPHPRIWVAARDPGTYDWALANGCSIMSWAISRPFAEVEKYKGQFDAALKAHPQAVPPSFLTMRHTAVYARPDQWEAPVNAVIEQSARFENLFKNLGGVQDGFAEAVDLAQLGNRAEYAPALLRENLMFGTPEEVIAKLKRYEALGVDYFNYSAGFGLPHAQQKNSLRLFIDEVMPAFAEKPHQLRVASQPRRGF